MLGVCVEFCLCSPWPASRQNWRFSSILSSATRCAWPTPSCSPSPPVSSRPGKMSTSSVPKDPLDGIGGILRCFSWDRQWHYAFWVSGGLWFIFCGAFLMREHNSFNLLRHARYFSPPPFPHVTLLSLSLPSYVTYILKIFFYTSVFKDKLIYTTSSGQNNK